MSPSRPFILRPVATALLMIALLLAGFVAYRQLPVSALPQVDYPTIQVITFYPGAAPDVMASSVTAPLERQFGQVPGLARMTSNSSEGCSVITAGLQPGDQVVTDGVDKLIDGSKVTVSQPKSPTTRTTGATTSASNGANPTPHRRNHAAPE